MINGYLDPSCIHASARGAERDEPGGPGFGNSGVGIVRGPGQHNLDLAVERCSR